MILLERLLGFMNHHFFWVF